MATQPKGVPKNIPIRDVFHTAPRASEVGTAGMRQLETVAAIKAEALALYYDVTGTVARDVPEELRDEAYDIQRHRRSPVAAVDRFCDILQRRVYVRHNLALSEARVKAARMLEYARQLIDLKLPAEPDPTPGHTAQGRESSHRGLGGRSVLGSDEAPHPSRAALFARTRAA